MSDRLEAITRDKRTTMHNERIGDWMQTYTGKQFWPLDPRIEEICIEDIAHSLAHQCRYGGHCREFYSVAQHSVLVSIACDSTDAAWGLLHDAAEAYLVDLPRPIKRYSHLGNEYRSIETNLMFAIRDLFALKGEEPESVKLADNRLLVTEMRDLMATPPVTWTEAKDSRNTPLSGNIRPLPPQEAEALFMRRFHELQIPVEYMDAI